MEKIRKKNTYMYITESLCCTVETNTILPINYTSILEKFKKEKYHLINFNSKFKYLLNTYSVLDIFRVPALPISHLEKSCRRKREGKK